MCEGFRFLSTLQLDIGVEQFIDHVGVLEFIDDS